MAVVLLAVVDRDKRLETYGELEIFRTFLGIQVESACLSVCSLSNIDVTNSLMLEHVDYPIMLFFS